MTFGDDLPVGVKRKELMCVGNFVALEDSEKCTVRVSPGVVVMKKGEACEFEDYSCFQN